MKTLVQNGHAISANSNEKDLIDRLGIIIADESDNKFMEYQNLLQTGEIEDLEDAVTFYNEYHSYSEDNKVSVK